MLLEYQVLIQIFLVAVLKFVQNKQSTWNWGKLRLTWHWDKIGSLNLRRSTVLVIRFGKLWLYSWTFIIIFLRELYLKLHHLRQFHRQVWDFFKEKKTMTIILRCSVVKCMLLQVNDNRLVINDSKFHCRG